MTDEEVEGLIRMVENLIAPLKEEIAVQNAELRELLAYREIAMRRIRELEGRK